MWRCDYRTHVLTISYIDLVIFAHVAQARVGEENFHYGGKGGGRKKGTTGRDKYKSPTCVKGKIET